MNVSDAFNFYFLWLYDLYLLMQALVGSLETKIVETEKRFEETNKLSEERLKQAMDAESVIVRLKTNMHRLVFF